MGILNQHFQYVMDNPAAVSTKEGNDSRVMMAESLKSADNCHAAYSKANIEFWGYDQRNQDLQVC